MPPSKKRRSIKDDSDSDDSDDDFLTSTRFTTRSTKRKPSAGGRNADCPDAKRNKAKELLDSLLQGSKEKVKRQDRIDAIHKRNSVLLNEDDISPNKKINDNKKNSSSNGKTTTSASSLQQTKSNKINHYHNRQAIDTKESQFFGSRNTLKLSRLISSSTVSSNGMAFSSSPYWSNFDEALTSLQNILLNDRQQQQSDTSSFGLLREELLQSTVTTSPRACRSYLKKTRLCVQNEPERIQCLPVDLLGWLVTVACGPIASTTKDEIQNEIANKRKPPGNLLLWNEAQTGAYQTLCRLWSKGTGYPEKDCNLFSVSDLPIFLKRWFGLTLPSVTAGEGKYTNNDMAKEQGVKDTDNSSSSSGIKNIEESIKVHIRNNRTALIRFLRLWALALQRQQNNSNGETDVYIIRHDYEKGHCKKFREDISDAIIAVLWAGLDHALASSETASCDVKRYIQTIVECLLDMVRQDDNFNTACYDQWLINLSERICEVWSKQLGRGQKGTDAYEEHSAWIPLSQTVDLLVCDDDASSLVGFQLRLSHCIINRAFHDDSHNLNNNDDWVSRLVDEELKISKVPTEACSSRSWQVIALASVGLAKLATLFPEDDGAKCYALLDICTVCFNIAVGDLQLKIQQQRRLKENRENDADDITMDNRSSTDDEHLESYALHATFERLENISRCLSEKTRHLIMQNICFPWASHMAESLRNYARLRKGPFAPPSGKNAIGSKKHQTTLESFLSDKKPVK